MRIVSVLYSVFNNRCPRCHHGKVFLKNNPYDLSCLFKMYDKCYYCGETYEKEPGYFWGAMYVSYALTSGLFIVLFVLDLLFFHLGLHLIWIIASAILLLAPVTFRWSRIIWLNFFIAYRPLSEKEKISAGDLK